VFSMRGMMFLINKLSKKERKGLGTFLSDLYPLTEMGCKTKLPLAISSQKSDPYAWIRSSSSKIHVDPSEEPSSPYVHEQQIH